MIREIVIVSGKGYAPWKMQRRNEWMVENSEGVLTLWNGDNLGGTFKCVQYAEAMRKPIINVWPEFLNG